MKITKNQLRRIIKEERAKLLKESRRPSTPAADNLEFAMDEYIKARALDGETDQMNIQAEIQGIMDSLWDDVSMQYGQIDTSRYQR